jgi:hypothetical protein
MKNICKHFSIIALMVVIGFSMAGCGEDDNSPALPNAAQIKSLTGIDGGLPSGIVGKVEEGGVIMRPDAIQPQAKLAIYWKNSNMASFTVVKTWLKNNGYTEESDESMNTAYSAKNADKTMSVLSQFSPEENNRLSLSFYPF